LQEKSNRAILTAQSLSLGCILCFPRLLKAGVFYVNSPDAHVNIAIYEVRENKPLNRGFFVLGHVKSNAKQDTGSQRINPYKAK